MSKNYPVYWCDECGREATTVAASLTGTACNTCGSQVQMLFGGGAELFRELREELDHAKACCTALANERDEALAHCTELAEDRDAWKDACLEARLVRDKAICDLNLARFIRDSLKEENEVLQVLDGELRAHCTKLMDERDRYKRVVYEMVDKKLKTEHEEAKKFWEEHSSRSFVRACMYIMTTLGLEYLHAED